MKALVLTAMLLTAVLLLMMHGRRTLPRPIRWPALTWIWAVVALLVLVVPGSKVLTFAGYLPVLIVGFPFGYPPVDYADVFTLTLLYQFLCFGGGLLIARAALRWQFRSHDACLRCGRGEHESRWASRTAARRWGRWAAWLAAAIPAAYGVTRVLWAVGIPAGIPRAMLDDMFATGLVWSGLGLGLFALAGAFLTLGLHQRWGEVFPRWTPGLTGRRVPIRLATVPATLVAVAVGAAAVEFYTSPGFFTSFVNDISLATLPMATWPLWAAGLGAATLAYYLRRRGGCTECGRGWAQTPSGTASRVSR